MTEVKICGLTQPETVKAAIEAGAKYLGFVFYAPSPRNINIESAAKLVNDLPDTIKKVGLFVDPDDETLAQTLDQVKLDMIQLHGHENPVRLEAIKSRFSLPIMKAIRIEMKNDLAAVKDYEEISDFLLFDTKADKMGGTGQAFDWMILQDFAHKRPWMLAGGLTPENIGDALSILKPDVVDVSSGVESALGQKSAAKIRDFIQAVNTHES